MVRRAACCVPHDPPAGTLALLSRAVRPASVPVTDVGAGFKPALCRITQIGQVSNLPLPTLCAVTANGAQSPPFLNGGLRSIVSQHYMIMLKSPLYPPLGKGGINRWRGTRDCMSFSLTLSTKTKTNLKKRFYLPIIQQNFRCLSPKNIVKWLRPWKIPLTSVGMSCQPRRTPPLERLPRS